MEKHADILEEVFLSHFEKYLSTGEEDKELHPPRKEKTVNDKSRFAVTRTRTPEIASRSENKKNGKNKGFSFLRRKNAKITDSSTVSPKSDKPASTSTKNEETQNRQTALSENHEPSFMENIGSKLEEFVLEPLLTPLCNVMDFVATLSLEPPRKSNAENMDPSMDS